MNVDGAGFDLHVVGVTPDARQQFLARYRTVGVLRQVPQQIHFTTGEYGLARRQVLGVDNQPVFQPDLARPVPGNPRPAQYRLHAQYQLRHGKWLGDIVVGAQCQSLHDVLVARFRGQHDDRLLPVLLADAITDFEPVDPGQHDIEQNQVVFTAQAKAQAIVAIVRGFDFVTVVDEHVDQAATNRGLVLDNQ